MKNILFKLLVIFGLFISNFANANNHESYNLKDSDIVKGSMEVLREGSEFVVESVSKTSEATIVTLKEVGKGTIVGVKLTGDAVSNFALATGDTVKSVAKGTGKTLEAAGKAIFNIPNAIINDLSKPEKK